MCVFQILTSILRPSDIAYSQGLSANNLRHPTQNNGECAKKKCLL